MQILLTITFLLPNYVDKAIAGFVKAGYAVSETNIKPSNGIDAASYVIQLRLGNELNPSDKNSEASFKNIKDILSDTKYYSVVYSDGLCNGVMPTNIFLTRKPKVKREVPYLKVIETKQENNSEPVQ